MESKPVLEWVRGNYKMWFAPTKIGKYQIEKSNAQVFYWLETERSISTCLKADSVDAAKQACEQDYISRCTERLELVRPGCVQIPVEMFRKLADSWCGACREEGLGDCRVCQIQQLLDGLPVSPVGYLAEGEVAVKRETALAAAIAIRRDPYIYNTKSEAEVALADLTRAMEGK